MLFFKSKSYGIRCVFILSLCWLTYQVAAQTSGTTSATNATATWLTQTSLQINWTIPNLPYDELIVVGKAGADFTDTPTGVNYTANSSFTAAGNQLFGGKVVYAGFGASVTVTNLPAGSRYFFRIFVRRGNAWTAGTPVASPDRAPVLIYQVTVLSGTATSPTTFTVTPTLNSLTASSPVTLRLDASQSYDLDGDRINYFWLFGGADTDDRPMLDRTFSIQAGRNGTAPITVFGASASVGGGGVSSGTQLLTINLVNTTPPATATTTVTSASAVWLTDNSLRLNWTNPTQAFDEVMVVGKAGADFTDGPTATTYVANASFTGNGTDLFGGKVLYRGSSTSVVVTNLPTGSRYFFRIFVRRGNVWTAGAPVASPNRSSVLIYKVTVLSGMSSSPTNFTVTPALNSLTASSPVTLRLDASQSYDLDGDRINYVWQFGGADTDDRPTLDRTFSIQPGRNGTAPITVFGATVTVSGGGGSRLLTIQLANTPPVGVTAVEPGKCYRLLARVSNKVLGVEGNALTDGAQVLQRTDVDQLAQRWRFESVGSGFYRIEAVHSQKVLDVLYGSTANGAGVHQWTFNGNWSYNQHWSLKRNTEGYFQIIGRNSGKALDVQNGNQTEGGFVMINTVDAGLNQQWSLEERTCTTAPPTSTITSPPTSTTTAPPTSTTGVAEGKCYRIQSRSNGLVLSIPGSSYDDGLTVRQNTNTNQSWQKWQFTPVNGSYYRISLLHNGKAIQVANSSTADDALLQQWTYWGGDHQQWIVQRNTEGFYTFRSRNANKAVTVRNASTAEGAEITQQTLGTGTNQQWSIVETTCTATARVASVGAEGAAMFSLRPNPASDYVLIDLSPALGKPVDLVLTDLIGRTVRQTRVNAARTEPYRFQIGQLPTGLYLIQVRAEGQEPAALRLLVQP